jgi:hypothetical protein
MPCWLARGTTMKNNMATPKAISTLWNKSVHTEARKPPMSV